MQTLQQNRTHGAFYVTTMSTCSSRCRDSVRYQSHLLGLAYNRRRRNVSRKQVVRFRFTCGTKTEVTELTYSNGRPIFVDWRSLSATMHLPSPPYLLPFRRALHSLISQVCQVCRVNNTLSGRTLKLLLTTTQQARLTRKSPQATSGSVTISLVGRLIQVYAAGKLS